MSTKEPLVSEVTDELHHYTSAVGLRGILSSQYFRATRFDQLNDREEVRHFRYYLVKSLTKIISKHIEIRAAKDAKLKRAIEDHGGYHLVAQEDASHLVERFYKTTFEGESDTPAFAVPFIISFCCHTSDDPYTQKNGLLSQWRAYGEAAGRFALVFDARGMEDLLAEEIARNSYSFLNLCDVVYDGDNVNFEEKFDILLDQVELDWRKHILSEGDGAPEDIFNEFIKSAARFKHRAFHEEREFRVVACPMSEELDQFFRKLGAPPARDLPFKAIEHDERKRPYIALFKELGRPLPIRRIIVGPHPQQARLLAEARELAGDISVHPSEAPYLG